MKDIFFELNQLFLFDGLITAVLVAFCSAVFSNVWILELTRPSKHALLHFMPKYYPKSGFIAKVLACNKCLGGWIAIIILLLWRITSITWAFAIGFDYFCNIVAFVIVYIVYSLMLVGFVGAMAIYFVKTTQKIFIDGRKGND